MVELMIDGVLQTVHVAILHLNDLVGNQIVTNSANMPVNYYMTQPPALGNIIYFVEGIFDESIPYGKLDIIDGKYHFVPFHIMYLHHDIIFPIRHEELDTERKKDLLKLCDVEFVHIRDKFKRIQVNIFVICKSSTDAIVAKIIFPESIEWKPNLNTKPKVEN